MGLQDREALWDDLNAWCLRRGVFLGGAPGHAFLLVTGKTPGLRGRLIRWLRGQTVLGSWELTPAALEIDSSAPLALKPKKSEIAALPEDEMKALVDELKAYMATQMFPARMRLRVEAGEFDNPMLQGILARIYWKKREAPDGRPSRAEFGCLQLIQSDKGENRNAEITQISRDHKLLAKELNCPVRPCIACADPPGEHRFSNRPHGTSMHSQN